VGAGEGGVVGERGGERVGELVGDVVGDVVGDAEGTGVGAPMHTLSSRSQCKEEQSYEVRQS